MDSDHTANDDSDATRDQRIDAIRTRFERQRQAGQEPKIEQFVDQVAIPLRSEVLRQLLCVELRAYAPADLESHLDAYVSRFPADDGLIRGVFEDLSRISADETVTPAERIGVDVERPEQTNADHRTDAPTQIDPHDDGLEMPEAPSRTYAVQREVGAGGMGLILEVWDEKLKRPLAMKVIRRNDVRHSYLTPSHSHLMRRFLREAEITAHLEHPGVVPVHDVGLDEHGKLYFTMRLIKGRSLHEVFREVKQGGSEWNAVRVLDVMVNVCQTMAFAHSRGIIHRDLKPANVMVGEFGETYVMDWGLAKSMSADEPVGEPLTRGRGKPSALERNPFVSSLGNREDATIDGAVLGTPAYMPPEQARGQVDKVDARSDVYAVGTMLYQLLTGSAPYTDEIPRRRKQELLEAVQQRPPTPIVRLNARVSPELVAICEKAMAREKAARYNDLREMAADLQAFMEHRVVRAYRTGPWIELHKWIRRNRGLAIASITAVLLAVTGLLAVIGIQLKAEDDLRSALTRETEQREQAESAKAAAIEAENEAVSAQEREEIARRRVEALYLSRESSGIRGEDPGLATLLAIEAADRESNVTTHATVLSALLELREERTFLGHESDVVACAFHPDGSRVATASSDHTAAIWDVQSGERLVWLVGHDSRVEDICFRPDGESLATASFDGTVKIWDSQTGVLQSTLTGHRGQVRMLAFGPQGKVLFSCSVDGTARAWDIRTGKVAHVFSGHRGLVTQLAVSPDGSRVATGSADRTARLWTSHGELIKVLEGHTGGISELAFSDDGLWLATAAGAPFDFVEGEQATKGTSQDGTVRIWHTSDGRLAHALEASHQRIDAARWSPDGRQLVSAGAEGVVSVWKFSPAAKAWQIEQSLGPLPAAEVTSLEFNSNGSHVLVSVQKKAYLMSLASGDIEARFQGHKGDIVASCLSPDGKWVLTASRDRTARLWRSTGSSLVRIPVGQATAKVRLHAAANRMLVHSTRTPEVLLCDFPEPEIIASMQLEDNCTWADLSPDGKKLATISQTGQLQLWSALDGQLLKNLGSIVGGLDASFSPDGQRLLVWFPKDFSISEWDLRSGARTRRFDTEGARPKRPCQNWSRLIARLSFDDPIQVWDVLRGEMLYELPPTSSVSLAALNADGSRLLLRSHVDNRAQLLDADTGEPVAWLKHDGQINSSPFSSDGRFLATAATDGTAKLWDARTGELLMSFTGSNANIVSVRLGPRLNYLATLSSENTVALFEVKTGQQLGVVGDKKRRLDDVLFSPDGSQILLRSGQAATHWETATARQVGTLQSADGGMLQSAKFSPDGDWIITSATKPNDSDGSPGVRIWPVDVSAFAKQRQPRLLTPDERDLFQVGSEAERKEERQQYELRLRRKSLADLAIRVQHGEGHLQVVRQAIRDVVDEIGELLKSQSLDVAEAAIGDISKLADEPGYEDSETLVLLSSIHEHTENLRDAILVLERAASCPNPPATAAMKLAELRDRVWPDIVSYASIDALFDHGTARPYLAMFRGFKQAVRNDMDTRVLYFAAKLNQRDQQHQAAIKALEEVLSSDPNHPRPYLRLAESLVAEGRPSDAEAVLRRALERPVRQARELWTAWATVNFVDLHTDAAQLLSGWPQSPAETTTMRSQAASEDLKWVCECLATGEFVGINCGGDRFTDSVGHVWSGDRCYLRGWGYLGENGTPQVYDGQIEGTVDDTLFQTERWFRGEKGGVLGYQVPLPRGQYRVTLHFAEIYHTRPGNRSFDVVLEGQWLLSEVDPSGSGLATAQVHQAEVSVTDGLLQVEFSPSKGDPNISAISIDPID